MNIDELNDFYMQFKAGEDSYHTLMHRRVRDVLLVSTFYDAFIFEQDGRLSEQIIGEYRQLNLSTAPRVVSVPTGEEALELLHRQSFDLVVTMMRVGRLGPFELADEAKKLYPELPVLLLLNVDSDMAVAQRRLPGSAIDDVFLWNGDTKLFLAMIKQVEDRLNVDEDTRLGYVRVVLLVEDSIRYCSRFLPILYAQIMEQTQRLIGQELSDIHKRLRMRARPKVLLAHTYDQAREWIDQYKDYLIAVISDVSYPRNGEVDDHAGHKLLAHLRTLPHDIPAVLQSSEQNNEPRATELGARFLWKHSPSISRDLRRIMKDDWGYGDFVFRDEHGREIARAGSVAEFRLRLQNVSGRSLVYHGSRNHFSAWLIAHGDIELAREMRPKKAGDFAGSDDLRRYLLGAFDRVWHRQTYGRIINFDPERLPERGHVLRLADGSLGGKARGLAFLAAMLSVLHTERRFPALAVGIPATAVVGTAEYDAFAAQLPDEEGQRQAASRQARLSHPLRERLRVFAQQGRQPLAVRSSGLLEDSYAHPFAGIYTTCMLPQSTNDPQRRIAALQGAVKEVFASVWSEEARRYIASIHRKPEEEKMAVVVQPVSGQRHGEVFYPALSGYLYWNMIEERGECRIVPGLGHGWECVLPAATTPPPKGWPPELRLHMPAMEYLYAIDLATNELMPPLRQVLVPASQTPMPPELGQALLFIAQMMSQALRMPVEMEFALPHKNLRQLDLLQVRPVAHAGGDAVQMPQLAPDDPRVLLWSTQVVGSGGIEGIRDVILLEEFSADEALVHWLRQLNARLRDEGRGFLLLGPGHWGAHDATRGVPVTWRDIDQVRFILQLPDGGEPALHRAHFLQNLAVLDIPYLTLHENDRFDLDWLRHQPHTHEGAYRHIRLRQPLGVFMDGRAGRLLITKQNIQATRPDKEA